MKVFGVKLHFPSASDAMLLVPVGAVAGTLGGVLIQHITHGSPAPVLGLSAAGAVSAFLAMSGADLDSGWRGVALTAVAAVVAFLAGTAWA